MIFKISNTQWSPSLLGEYPILCKYGYYNERKKVVWGGAEGYIVVDSLEELVNLSKDLNHDIIILNNGTEPEIEIYDDYRE